MNQKEPNQISVRVSDLSQERISSSEPEKIRRSLKNRLSPDECPVKGLMIGQPSNGGQSEKWPNREERSKMALARTF
ncbi:hypothetical protein HPP92_006178 [Vanilla planifolia]|uniref:Uncharacterized protein n=1 Tax=Vanilla planifolia TaxID=51239 RepID=A0A835RNZ5_VANPL|nr:hypothetical protein HPP92_006470 [Vanilla planifolia]KAG0495184.1 hypothetical protein HPP92_006178 [Vanilla planifolia]